MMIKIEHLTKSFGALVVLRDVNAEIKRGEVVSIIGPSGVGKSTFLRCLNLLDHPTSGSIFIDGVDVLHRKTNVSKIRQKMNMVFQSFNLFAHLSVLDNVTIAPIKLHGLPRDAAEGKALDLLRMVGLGEKASCFLDELSGGQKQRVAIARCLAMEPEIVLFDEHNSQIRKIALARSPSFQIVSCNGFVPLAIVGRFFRKLGEVSQWLERLRRY